VSDMSFSWCGQSSDDYGVVVTSLPPVYKPQPRDDSSQIPGRHGKLHRNTGEYDEQLMVIEGYLPYEQEGTAVESLDAIKGWLQGYGDLTLSDQPGRRYKAHILDGIAFSPWVAGFSDRIFSVSFWCDPLAYEEIPEERNLKTARVLQNLGNVEADPLITVYGLGDVTLTVGDIRVTLTNMTAPVTIDCDAKVAYQGDGVGGAGVAITLEDRVWPSLGLGDTRISWSGNVSKVRIVPNWRWS